MEATTMVGANERSTVSDGRPHSPGDRETYCPQLQRLLMSAAGELGLHGANFERGCGSTEDPNYAMLRRIGFPQDVDRNGRAHRRQIVGPLTALERRWRQLSREHQILALAHYPGTLRCPETLRSHFGEFAGVVLHRWLTRHARNRDRLARGGSEKAQARLAEVRQELVPLELELARLRALNRRPARLPEGDPRPTLGELPQDNEAAAAALRQHKLDVRAWNAHQAACRAVARFLAGLRALNINQRIAQAEAAAHPLREESALLCAQESALHGAGDVSADEEELLDACGRRKKKKRPELLPGGKDDLTKPAIADVRTLHRAWRDTARQTARAWVLEGELEAS